MAERTVARVAPDTTNGVVVNIEVVAPDWVNDDPTHLIEYDAEHPAGIGWAVVDGVVVRPYVQEDLPIGVVAE
jgi:hypothetical protein